METELEVLKKIQENKGKPFSIRLISSQTGFGLDYLRYICQNLLRKNFVNCQGRDLYLINRRGEKELERKGLIKPKPSKITKSLRVPRLAFLKPKEIKVKTLPAVSNKIEINSSSSKPKEEKLSLGKKVEKAVLFLKRLRDEL